MLVRFGKACVIVTLVATLGAQWALLQTVAWTTMLANNLHSHSLTEAVSDTFDGRHLCPLCKAIAAAKKSEKKNEAVSPGQKFEFPPITETIVLTAPAVPRFSPRLNFYPGSRFQKPPTPPPRGFFV
jgi:hypothetical protein